ncbi:MAG: DUF1572 family protein [Gemmatimonadaceae bacterium]
MRDLIEAITAEYLRYKALGEAALQQVDERYLSAAGPGNGNSLAIIVWHLSGNLASRFTDFLTDDGEKPWRQREEEFKRRDVSRPALMEKWDSGWSVLLTTLADLTDSDLGRVITIRRQPLTVREALLRSLAHASYHVGQIVYLGKALCGDRWRYLSIAPGASDAYNANPTGESASAHASQLSGRSGHA